MFLLNLISFINTFDHNYLNKDTNENRFNPTFTYFHLTSKESNINNNKIAIIDFRYILKRSNAMVILGNKFIMFEKKINEKIKLKQSLLKKKEKLILDDKKNLTSVEYKNKIKLFKEEVFQTQVVYKKERTLLNKSFQKIQKKIKNLLAQIIKDVSNKKNINVVLLKENVFLFNDPTIDLTSEVLNLFDQKTKSMKITITMND